MFFQYYYIMVLSSYCKSCNQTIGHIHIPYQIMLITLADEIEKDPSLHKKILEDLGLNLDCCRNYVFSGTMDSNLKNYVGMVARSQMKNGKGSE